MIVLPSRNRPERLQQFIDGYRATGATAPVYLRIDYDDDYLPAYDAIELPDNWLRVTGERKKFVGACNEMLEKFPNEPYYAFMADDIVPRTQGWDAALIEAAGRDRVAWGNDIMQAPKCTHPFIGGDLMRHVGWFAAPGFLHWYIDTTWEWLANKTGRAVYLPTVVTEHVHYEANGALYDRTYHERFLDVATGKKVGTGPDEARWVQWRDHEAPALIASIEEAFGHG